MSISFDPTRNTNYTLRPPTESSTTTMAGGAGTDVFDFQLSGNKIDTFESGTMLCFGGDLLNTLPGAYGSDTLEGNNTLIGGPGNDTIVGGGGNDII